jgi:mannitol-specific phosphotransferase system IIBC component
MANAKKKSSNDSMAAIRLTVNLVSAIAVGVGAWLASPTLVDLLQSNVPALNGLAVSDFVFQIIVAVVTFLLGIMLVSLLIVAILPKDSRESNEREIAKEQAQMHAKRRKATGRKGTVKRQKR